MAKIGIKARKNGYAYLKVFACNLVCKTNGIENQPPINAAFAGVSEVLEMLELESLV